MVECNTKLGETAVKTENTLHYHIQLAMMFCCAHLDIILHCNTSLPAYIMLHKILSPLTVSLILWLFFGHFTNDRLQPCPAYCKIKFPIPLMSWRLQYWGQINSRDCLMFWLLKQSLAITIINIGFSFYYQVLYIVWQSSTYVMKWNEYLI